MDYFFSAPHMRPRSAGGEAQAHAGSPKVGSSQALPSFEGGCLKDSKHTTQGQPSAGVHGHQGK